MDGVGNRGKESRERRKEEDRKVGGTWREGGEEEGEKRERR